MFYPFYKIIIAYYGIVSSLTLAACGPTLPSLLLDACRLYTINNILCMPVVYHVLVTKHWAPLHMFVPPALSCVVDRGKPDQRTVIIYIKLHGTLVVL